MMDRSRLRWGPLLEATLAVQLVLSIMAELGSATPAWNLFLCLLGLYALWSRNARALLLFMVGTAFSIIMDITWCGIYGPSIHDMIDGGYPSELGSTQNFGLAMLILNMFAKFPALFFARGLFTQLGGAWSLSQPVTGGGGEGDYGQMFDDAPGAIGSAPGGASGYAAPAQATTANPAAAAPPVEYAGYQSGAHVTVPLDDDETPKGTKAPTTY